jgi:F-type H+-transporting ATPase subunit a
VSEATHDTHAHAVERRVPVKRWIVLVLVLVGAWAAFIAPSQGLGFLKPAPPAVVLPAEPITPGSPITNVLLGTLVADLVLVLMAFGAWRFKASGKLIPEGFYGFTEFLVEFLWNATESTAGKWARKIFPVTATIFFLVFAANMTKLLPIYETIGGLEQAHGSIKGYAPVHLFGNVWAIDPTKPVAHDATEATTTEAEGGAPCTSCTVVPWLRAPATDLNFTFALAIIAVVMTQYFGFAALGPAYLQKFFNFKTMFTVPMFGVIDFAVGILELVSEFAKILSFGFRLFGNIFAGTLLLSILGALTAVVVPGALYGLETFVGAIQAYVFSMLALVFMSQATIGHGGGEEHH